jgi:predicted DNA-binding transcriptional regulator YafY
MRKIPAEGDTVPKLLRVVAEIMQGRRYSRHTVAESTGRSLATADRWIEHILELVPHMKPVKEGRAKWVVYVGDDKEKPSKLAVVGACVAASLASMFEGTRHERNLKDARDYLMRQRGERYPDIDRKFVFAPRGGEYALPEGAGDLDEVIDGLLDGRRLTFSYQHNNGRTEKLDVEPLSLVLFDHQFYVLARRSDRSFYCYRFARMSGVDATNESFEYPSKNEYDPRNVLEPGFGVHISGTGPMEDVAVVLRGAWASFARRHRWHPTQQVESGADGSVLVTLRVRLCPELETWVLGFGEHATVVRPPRLRELIAARLTKAAEVYSPGGQNQAARPDVRKARPESGAEPVASRSGAPRRR